jgi:ABC-type Fe3+ transport system permease subunit
MYIVLISLVLGFFVALLFVNFYFRWRVLKIYHYLTARKIEFSTEHIFNRKKLKADILPKYPDSQQEILTFVNYIHFSVKMASALVLLVTAFGLILMYYSRYEG